MVQSSVAGGACTKESGHKTSSIRLASPLPQTDIWTQPISHTFFRMSHLKKSKLPLRNGCLPSTLQMAGKPQKFADSRTKPTLQMMTNDSNCIKAVAESGKITQHSLQDHNQTYDLIRRVHRQNSSIPQMSNNFSSCDENQFQASAAASFFARAAQKLDLSPTKRKKAYEQEINLECCQFLTNFTDILHHSPPPAPPALLRSVGRKDVGGLGKVKVMLRVSPLASQSDCNSSFLQIDSRKKQVTAYDPSTCGFTTPEDRRVGVAAPKMFAFDAIFSQDDSQTEICSSSLTEVVQAVVNGTDGCLFSYGASNLGKTYTMIGKSDSVQSLGAIPCAISWLFKLINEEKQKTGARFSVRVSAVEIAGKNDELRDLLAEFASDSNGTSPAIYLEDDSTFGAQLQNQTELRAPTVEKAAYYLDAAIASRNQSDDDVSSHFLFTLHVYQHRIDKSDKVSGGRSRLHFLDLANCEKQGKNSGLSLSATTNVILAIFNGQKHIPFRNCILTRVLCEVFGSLTCRAAMIAHVSPSLSNYNESLSTIQFASRIHRLRRKKIKHSNFNPIDTDDAMMEKFGENGVKSGSSDPDYTSSSEQSCDTVIYVGHNGLPFSDKDLTDNEGPPTHLSKINPTTESLQNVRGNLVKKLDSREIQQSEKCVSKVVPQFVKPVADCRIPVFTKMSTSWSSDKIVAEGLIRHQSAGMKLRPSSQNFRKINITRSLTSAGSEERWVDGPRFSKSRLEARSTLLPRHEMWVDGPQAVYGYMDVHKRKMIQRWVELQASHIPEIEPSIPSEDNCHLSEIDEQSAKDDDEAIDDDQETRSSDAFLKMEPSHVMVEFQTRITRSISFSSSLYKLGRSRSDSPDPQNCGNGEDQRVFTQDSCLQVTEDDILEACMGMIEEHPLRILSEENLASSFTDSLSLGENLSVCESEDCEEAMEIALDKLTRFSVPCNLSNTYVGTHGADDGMYNDIDNQVVLNSLRLPDGASNPNLCEEPVQVKTEVEEKIVVKRSNGRSPGNGADEENYKLPNNCQIVSEKVDVSQSPRLYSKIPKLVKSTSGVKKSSVVNLKKNLPSKTLNLQQTVNSSPEKMALNEDKEKLFVVARHIPLADRTSSVDIVEKLNFKSDSTFQASGTSSGYESMVRDSEGSGSSFSNPELTSDTSEDEEHKKHRQLLSASGLENDILQVQEYDKEDVERIERRRLMEEKHELKQYHQKILRLRIKQNELRKELAMAKERLMLSPQRWSYDLHVEECVNDADPCFLEVLERETQILEKRVTACKSRIMIVTCFDSTTNI